MSDELTAEQVAFLDAVTDVATTPDAPGADRCARALVRFLAYTFELPDPEPPREGGLAGFLYGNPRKPEARP